ncbi:MAG: GTP-binding protein [Candidatus Kariarchaeaceae archaeon]|jgi:small GTP-binding protein
MERKRTASKKRNMYKCVIIGEPAVGKTSLRKRYLGQGFEASYSMTIGADFAVKRKGENAIQIWDLAGQQGFSEVRSLYYKGAQGGIIVFDIVRPLSYERVTLWIDEMLRQANRNLPIVLVGNKADLRGSANDAVSTEEAQEYAKALSDWSGFEVPYVEASALTGLNVDLIFDKLIEEIGYLIATESSGR